MTVTGPPPPPLPALAVPDERRGLPVPVAGRLLEPGADLGRAPRLLPVESAPLEDALDRFGHVQPAAARRRVERHEAVGPVADVVGIGGGVVSGSFTEP